MKTKKIYKRRRSEEKNHFTLSFLHLNNENNKIRILTAKKNKQILNLSTLHFLPCPPHPHPHPRPHPHPHF